MQWKQDVKVVTIKRKIALKRPESLRSNLGSKKIAYLATIQLCCQRSDFWLNTSDFLISGCSVVKVYITTCKVSDVFVGWSKGWIQPLADLHKSVEIKLVCISLSVNLLQYTLVVVVSKININIISWQILNFTKLWILRILLISKIVPLIN